jgi:hypothetical protein
VLADMLEVEEAITDQGVPAGACGSALRWAMAG